jgi:hypothetical protein
MLLLWGILYPVPTASCALLIPAIHPGNQYTAVAVVWFSDYLRCGGEGDQLCSDSDDATLSMDLPSGGAGATMIDATVTSTVDPIDFHEVSLTSF